MAASVTGFFNFVARKTRLRNIDSVNFSFWMAGGMAHTRPFDQKNTLLLQKEWMQILVLNTNYIAY